ncbi:hypothetical protein Hrd1104_06380 [Halorhabdus sp. CBA1104]|nr:hypothetical protein Hrd1104_06380 [Halorhabdus sp. CBA1104]
MHSDGNQRVPRRATVTADSGVDKTPLDRVVTVQWDTRSQDGEAVSAAERTVGIFARLPAAVPTPNRDVFEGGVSGWN